MSISAVSFRLVVTRIKIMKLRDLDRVDSVLKTPGRVTFPFNVLRCRHLTKIRLEFSYIAKYFANLN